MSDTEHRSTPAAMPWRFRWQHRLGSMLGKRFDRLLAGIHDGQLTVTWPDGSATRHGQHSTETGHNAHVVFNNFRPVREMMLRGEVGFAESYLRGDWSADCLTDLFLLIMRNEREIDDATSGSIVARVLNTIRHTLNRNSERGSRRNISFHYDLGNDFYRLWLDPAMNYSSAMYDHDGQSLEDAQQVKLQRVVELLAPVEGARILEIGCGWGAMAEKLARDSNGHVTGISLSREQLSWASDQRQVGTVQGTSVEAPASDASPCGTTEYLLRDYRLMQGRYDHIVSIEMFEAVGEKYWRTYFTRLADLLEQGGTAVLQVITILEERFEGYRASPDFIQRYIFPGGMLPSKTHLTTLADEAGLDISSSEWFGDSYARTLADWRDRFDHVLREVHSQGFDDCFVRMWRYYLSYCEAGFLFGSTDVGLLKLVRR